MQRRTVHVRPGLRAEGEAVGRPPASRRPCPLPGPPSIATVTVTTSPLPAVFVSCSVLEDWWECGTPACHLPWEVVTLGFGFVVLEAQLGTIFRWGGEFETLLKHSWPQRGKNAWCIAGRKKCVLSSTPSPDASFPLHSFIPSPANVSRDCTSVACHATVCECKVAKFTKDCNAFSDLQDLFHYVTPDLLPFVPCSWAFDRCLFFKELGWKVEFQIKARFTRRFPVYSHET